MTWTAPKAVSQSVGGAARGRAARSSVDRLSGERREPRADRLEEQLVRLCGNVLHRGGVREEAPGAAYNLGLARNVRQVQFGEDVHRGERGGERLRLGKAGADIGQAALSERRR